MRAHFEMGLDISHPEVLIGCAQDIGMPPELAALAVGDEEWASRVVFGLPDGDAHGCHHRPHVRL